MDKKAIISLLVALTIWELVLKNLISEVAVKGKEIVTKGPTP